MARPFGRDRRGSDSNSSSNIKLQSGGRTRRSKKRGKAKERLLLVVGLIVVVLIVLRKKVTKKKKRIFPNQKLEQGKNNQKGLSLDPQRNHQNHQQQLHFQHHQHNQNQTQNQILISRQVVEGEEKEQEQQEQEASEKEEPSSFHGFHNQYFQQAQEFHQQHQFLYGGGGLDSQSLQPPPPQPPKTNKRSYLPSSSSQTKEYASGLREKMGDTTTSQNHQTITSSRLRGLRNTVVVGEVVEVQGGHIVRSTGRKDRHSKVCTAKGPRDRRVRLSAHTAIQFYDVQDRLGYDRPSKVVDWLIKKAKAAVDELEELPAWTPTANPIPINPPNSEQEDQNHNQHHQQQLQHQQHIHHSIGGGSTSNARRLNDQQQQPNENNSSSFLPPSMDSDSIADTIKSFFPMGASTETNSSSAAANIQFHHNFPPTDLLSRTNSQSQDLRLSLQSFQDPMLLHHHNHQNQQQNEQAAGLFSGNTQMGFDGSGWSENPPGEMGRFQRMMSWNASGDTGHSGGGGGAFVFNSPPAQAAQPMLQPLFGQSHQLFFSQRGPLQSSNTPSVRAWIDPSAFSAASDHHQNQASLPFHPSSTSGIGFASGGGFSGFRIPARIQGEEEEHDGISDKPSSASSDSRH